MKSERRVNYLIICAMIALALSHSRGWEKLGWNSGIYYYKVHTQTILFSPENWRVRREIEK